MKKLLLLALTAVIVAGCVEQKRNNLLEYKSKYGVKIAIIDSCEYIVNEEKYAFAYTESAYKTYTHKGNCKYCEQRRRQELREFVEQIKK